jgi:polysaccharide biosynthesis protein PslH
MKTILLIARCPPYPLHLGDRLIIWHLARELAQRGCTLDLLAFANRSSDHQETDAYRAYFRHIHLIDEPQRPYPSYIRRILLPASRFPRQASASWSPAMWQAIAQHAQQHTYDLAHVFGGVQVYEFRHAVGSLPALIVPYESYSLYLKRQIAARQGLARAAALAQQIIARQFESWMFTPYRQVVVVSDKDQQELQAINPALNVTVIPNGIDLDYFQPAAATREPATLLFVGNYEYEPNEDAALWLARTLLPQMQAHIPQARLWLVGNAPTPAMQALASDTVIVTGRVPDVRPYLAQATVFVSPLRLGAGIKNKVLEALALGCPLAATPLSVDGIAVRHEHDALVFPMGELPAAVVRLLRDPDLQHRLSAAGRQLIVGRYSWAQVAEAYLQLYAALTLPQ